MKMALMFHHGSRVKMFHIINTTKPHITSLIVLLSMFSSVWKVFYLLNFYCSYICLKTIPIAFILQILRMSIVNFHFHHVATQNPGTAPNL